MITLPIAELKPVLTGLGKVISKNPALPILGMVKIERTRDGWTTLTGTDLDEFITARMEQPGEEEPECLLVPFHDLQRIAKACDAKQSITLQAKNNKALVRYPIGNQSGEEHLDSIPVDDYPDIPRIKATPIGLDANIRGALLQALDCASSDPVRRILQGACIDVSDKQCHAIVGTDGKHLFSSNSFSLPLNQSIIIPTSRFLGWKDFNNDGEWQLRVEKEHVQISSRRYRFIARLVDGNYPNWRHVLPKEFNISVEFVDEEMCDLIPRLPVNPKDSNNTIGLKIGNGKLAILVRSGSEEQPTEVDVKGAKITGAPITVYLNRSFMLKALKCGCNKLEIVDDTSAMRFSNGGKQLVVMPVRSMEVSKSVPPPLEATEPEQQTRSTPMHIEATEPKPADRPAMESAIAQVETVREALRTTLGSISELLALLRQAHREQRVSEREMHSVRQTLRSLQSVRI